MPKVSITIPTYNRSVLVRDAIDSALAQTFEDIEVVVIDDGSTDDTRKVVESYEDPRVKYFYKENGGCSSARNSGLDHCTGEYIGFLDSDDLWPENFVEVLLGKLQNNPEYSCAYCPMIKVDPDGNETPSYGQKQCRSGSITADLFSTGFIWIQTTLFKRSVFENFRFDATMKNAADTDAILRLSVKIKYLYVPEIHVTFREKHGVAPRTNVSSLNCNRILLLERFYFRLGGDRYVPANVAKKKLSHAYRSVGKTYYKKKCRNAAIQLFKKSISYRPLDIRLYSNLIAAYKLDKDKDEMKDWKIPNALPYI